MLSLSSTQILAAVRRSLETHVLPEIGDDFARVQIAAALKALEEVGDRLENGDPCERANSRLEAGLREIAGGARDASPEFAAGLEAILETPSRGDEPRERARDLGEALVALLRTSDTPAKRQVLELLQGEVGRNAGEDLRWACPEALQSLQ
jgi:hypothetical protein